MTATSYECIPQPAHADPYGFDGGAYGDFPIAPPHPPARSDVAIDPRDRRRLELHAALTAAGIPPLPEDREAIDRLSALPGNINHTIQRWLQHSL